RAASSACRKTIRQCPSMVDLPPGLAMGEVDSAMLRWDASSAQLILLIRGRHHPALLSTALRSTGYPVGREGAPAIPARPGHPPWATTKGPGRCRAGALVSRGGRPGRPVRGAEPARRLAVRLVPYSEALVSRLGVGTLGRGTEGGVDLPDHVAA